MPLICSPKILSDVSDFNISEPLTVALLLTAVFTTTKLNDFNFLATAMSNNFSFNFNAFNYWSADLDIFTISDHQNLVKLNSFTGCDVQLFQANCLTFAYSVLFTTTLENCVHINSAFRAPPKISFQSAL
ncbi:hypothetical protein XBFM1_1260088 [Xenorhabdus bovienii str. feltiae Moldova]|uniref:Uncharacterized protein n=1 Tax=Xenorhabdus bovienii str. feltiae Moldova TaxID=1398200 RepID=A0A077NMX9_XENBV|nr:hypothetical protein XBFM1_1260088 [Xenorhabdus bovienii str. feltiae Moldova]